MDRQIEPANTHLILDPAYGQTAAQHYFRPHLEALREVVAFGGNLILRCFVTMERSIGNTMLVGVLFRQAVAALDAFALCLENGAVDAAEVHSRGALEASLSIDWVLKRGKDEWGRRLWVYALRQNLHWARKIIPGRTEHERYMESRTELGVPRIISEEDKQKALATESELTGMLTQDSFREINADFEALAKKLGREPEWYRPGKDGVRSVYQMAKEVRRVNEYESFYKTMSYSVHGSHAFKALELSGGRVGIEPIRALEHFPTTFGIGVNTAVRVYITMLKEYRADEAKGFGRKFLDEWQSKLRNLPTVTVEPEVINL